MSPIRLLLLSTVTTWWPMMTSSNGNIFRVTGPLCGEFTGHRWISLTKASDASMFSLICAWTNSRVNNRDTGDLKRHRAHYDVTVMTTSIVVGVDTVVTINTYCRPCKFKAFEQIVAKISLWLVLLQSKFTPLYYVVNTGWFLRKFFWIYVASNMKIAR